MRHSWPELLHRAQLAEFHDSFMPPAYCAGLVEVGGETQQCGRSPLPGLPWCWAHAEVDRDEWLLQRGLERTAHARSVLFENAPMVAARLVSIAINGRDREAVTAASSVLDRVGIRSGVEVHGKVTHAVDDSPLDTLLERFAEMKRRKEAIDAVSRETETESD